MSKRERLRIWLESLDSDKVIDIAVECIDELIDAEQIRFYETTKVPYWDGSGDNLDGSDFEE
jgi:hypothetical protein